MTHPAWIDERALTIAKKIEADHKLTDSSHFNLSRVIALIQIGAIEALTSMTEKGVTNEKKLTVFLELSEAETQVTEQLSREQDLPIAALFRQMLRSFQIDHERRKAGETCTWSGDEQRMKDFAGPCLNDPERQ